MYAAGLKVKKSRAELEDAQHICNCKLETRCGDACFNRSIRIECDSSSCPCGEQCTNNEFQKRKWAKVQVKQVGKKGFGLFTMQDLERGQFIIEYVGEVIENDEVADRMSTIMEQDGDHHFYFLRLNPNATIDASRKGNDARFANHSCSPNCKTEKWYVLGETRVGLFALDKIKAGTELTFDYCFEIVGDAELTCHCGAENCRGTIRARDPAPKKIKTPEELEQEFNRRQANRLKATFAQLVNEITNFKITTSMEQGGKRKVFLLRNIRKNQQRLEKLYEDLDDVCLTLLYSCVNICA